MKLLTRPILPLILTIQLVVVVFACVGEFFSPGIVSFTTPLEIVLIIFIVTWLIFITIEN